MASLSCPSPRIGGAEAFDRHNTKNQLLLKSMKPSTFSRLASVKEQAGSQGGEIS